MSDRCWYNLHGWQVFYESTLGMKAVIPSNPGIYQYDDFTQVATTDLTGVTNWEVTNNGGTAAVAAGEYEGEHGVARLTSHTDDNDGCILYLPQPISPSYDPVVECRLRIETATSLKFGFGFADATAVAGTGNLGTYVAATPTVVGDDGALMVFDTDATTDYVYYMTQKATATEQSGTAYAGTPVANTSYYLRVHLQDDGTYTQAYFYWDGVLVGSVTDAVTRTVELYPAVSVATAVGAAAKHIEVDYIRTWARRG
jgi:hypothetical protein